MDARILRLLAASFLASNLDEAIEACEFEAGDGQRLISVHGLVFDVPTEEEVAALLETEKNRALVDAQRRAEIIEMVRDRYAEEGRIEIDQDADVLISSNGAYVSAWVFVDNSETVEENDA